MYIEFQRISSMYIFYPNIFSYSLFVNDLENQKLPWDITWTVQDVLPNKLINSRLRKRSSWLERECLKNVAVNVTLWGTVRGLFSLTDKCFYFRLSIIKYNTGSLTLTCVFRLMNILFDSLFVLNKNTNLFKYEETIV